MPAKFPEVTQVPVIVPSFVRPMVHIWGPCPKLRPRVAPAMPSGSVPKRILNASQRHENLWPLGMKDKGKNAGKPTDDLGTHDTVFIYLYTLHYILEIVNNILTIILAWKFWKDLFVDGFEYYSN